MRELYEVLASCSSLLLSAANFAHTQVPVYSAVAHHLSTIRSRLIKLLLQALLSLLVASRDTEVGPSIQCRCGKCRRTGHNARTCQKDRETSSGSEIILSGMFSDSVDSASDDGES